MSHAPTPWPYKTIKQWQWILNWKKVKPWLRPDVQLSFPSIIGIINIYCTCCTKNKMHKLNYCSFYSICYPPPPKKKKSCEILATALKLVFYLILCACAHSNIISLCKRRKLKICMQWDTTIRQAHNKNQVSTRIILWDNYF